MARIDGFVHQQFKPYIRFIELKSDLLGPQIEIANRPGKIGSKLTAAAARLHFLDHRSNTNLNLLIVRCI